MIEFDHEETNNIKSDTIKKKTTTKKTNKTKQKLMSPLVLLKERC